MSSPRCFHARCLLVALLWCASGHLSAQTAPDSGDDIRGPKPMVEIPQPEERPVALWSGIGGGLLLATFAVWFWKRRSSRRDLKSPREIALASLNKLEATCDAVTAETFGNRAAQTVRQYVADRFGLAAPRRTTEEFLHDLTDNPSLTGESDHLRAFLKSCDLAKFAGSQLDAAQRGNLLQTARDFIRSTAAPAPSPKSKAATP